MLTQSHIFIAKKISSGLHTEFNHSYFYFGNIAPDFLHQHKKRKHEYQYSFSYILQEINSLENVTDINLISYKMGIITHYLADFFCKAHNCDRLINNLWQHFQYELLLHKVLISSKNETQLDKDICNIEAYIEGKYASYLKQNPSVFIDIMYSLEVCQNVMYHILEKANKNTLRKIA